MKPSILMVVRPATGGLKKHVELLMAGLIERGYKVGIVGPEDLEIEPSVAAGSWTRFTSPVSSKNPLALRKIAQKVAEYAAGFDVIHVHGISPSIVCAKASRIAGKPLVVTIHNQIPAMNPLEKRVVLSAVLQAKTVIPVSKAVSNELAKLGIPSANIKVIPNGIDLNCFTTIPPATQISPDGPIRLLAVGRLSPEKGFDLLIEAMKSLPDNYSLTIAGDGPDRQKLEGLASGLQVQFAGKVNDIPGLMAQSDIVVIPSRQEGQGIVALEAMAAGRPLVATRVGGLIETLGDGEFGVLVDPESPDALAERIQELIGDAEGQTNRTAMARERAMRDYSVDGMVEKVESVYQDALK
ncbi:MAG: glycosyltransferase family 4 protein [Chthonomonadales bacterium]